MPLFLKQAMLIIFKNLYNGEKSKRLLTTKKGEKVGTKKGGYDHL